MPKRVRIEGTIKPEIRHVRVKHMVNRREMHQKRKKYSLGMHEMKGRLRKHSLFDRCKEEDWHQNQKQNSVVGFFF